MIRRQLQLGSAPLRAYNRLVSSFDAAPAPPPVSILIPVYNTRAYLQRAMESALGQTLPGIELIVVDDGSADGSAQLCDSYAARGLPRLKIEHQAHQGAAAARNRALKLAGGEYLAFLDSDDYLAADFCERLYTLAHARHADICKGELCVCHGEQITPPSRDNQLIRSQGSRLFFICNWFTALYRRAWIEEQAIGFRPGIQLGEDLLFQHQAVLACRRLALEDHALYYYCRRTGSCDAQPLNAALAGNLLEVYAAIAASLSRNQQDLDGPGMAFVLWRCIQNLNIAAARAAGSELPEARACQQLAAQLRAGCPPAARSTLRHLLEQELRARQALAARSPP